MAYRISTDMIIEANEKLIMQKGRSTNMVSNDSKDGNIKFTTLILGKIYEIDIPEEKLRAAFAAALARMRKNDY